LSSAEQASKIKSNLWSKFHWIPFWFPSKRYF